MLVKGCNNRKIIDVSKFFYPFLAMILAMSTAIIDFLTKNFLVIKGVYLIWKDNSAQSESEQTETVMDILGYNQANYKSQS